MRKIVFYINCIANGGAERVISNLANQMDSAGCECIMVTSFRTPVEYPLNEGVKRYSLSDEKISESRLQKIISLVHRLRKIVKQEKPDIVVSFMAEPNYRALLATAFLKTKNLISVRTDPVREYPGKVGYILSRVLLPTTDGCVYQTEDARKWFSESLQKKSRVIFNPVKADFFRTERKPVKDRILMFGRLTDKKNNMLAVDAVKMLKDKYPGMQLLMYGEGPLEQEINDHIRAEGMEDTAKLMGRTENVPEWHSTADVFILPSKFEGAPNSLMEALAMGIPSVSSDCPCGGPKMLIDNMENGILVPVDDTKALADAVDTLLGDEELRRTMSEKAKKRSVEFDPEKVFESWKEYIELLTKEQ